MSGIRNALADNVRPFLVVLGVGLTMLGGVGPGPVGPAVVFGLVALLAAFFLTEPLEALLRADPKAEETEYEDPVESLRERYVAGDLDDEEFERQLETTLAAQEGAAGPASPTERTEAPAKSPLDRDAE